MASWWQVQKWRRGVNYPPPPWDALQRAATVDRRYADVPVPECESLAECTARLRPFLDETLFPDMRRAMAAAAEKAHWRSERFAKLRSGTVARGDAAARGQQRGGSGGGQRRDRVSMMGEADGVAETPSASYHSGAADGPSGVPSFVVASSENLIRALVAELEGLDDNDIPLLDLSLIHI